MLKTSLTLLLILVQGIAFAGAQATTEKTLDAAAPKVTMPLPFKPGETLIYEVSFSKFIFSGTIGELTLTVAEREGPPSKGLLELKAEAVSKGFFPKLFGVKVKDRFNSLVHPEDFGLHTSVKQIEEGNVRREQKSLIDRQAGRVTYIDRDLANASAKPKIKEADSPKWIQDVLSACYFVRTQELKEGDVISIPISDVGEVYNIEVVVRKREEVKVDAGKFKTLQLEAKVFDGRFIRRSGELFIWVTDDPLRVPVRAKIKTSGTTVTVSLRQIKHS